MAIAIRPPALIRPFQRFFHLESASGILLLLCAVLALAWSNSPWQQSYFSLWNTTITVDIALVNISKPLLLWINDGLMAIFFFVVGLEIKREVLLGELSTPRKAALSIAAAVGGMVVPALIYTIWNAGGAGEAGWGIPMATDIAFALGVLALLGSRVPTALKIFVTAVAIVDDLGAVLVIALFYTDKLSFAYLGGGLLLLGVLLGMNLAGVRRVAPYMLIGLLIWVAFLKSGVHATVAGVLVAAMIPARRSIDAPEFLRCAEVYLREFAEDLKPGHSEPTEDQRDAVHSLEVAAERLRTPLAHLEHEMHPWVAFFIMPVFALANAGVSLGGGAGEGITEPVTIGIAAGLLLGKPIGIFLAAWLSTAVGIAQLPAGIRWAQIFGVSVLCGIGFTMSLFIGSLAFGNEQLLNQAKIGILTGSLVAGLVGPIILSLLSGKRRAWLDIPRLFYDRG